LQLDRTKELPRISLPYKHYYRELSILQLASFSKSFVFLLQVKHSLLLPSFFLSLPLLISFSLLPTFSLTLNLVLSISFNHLS